jgi:hypothetical protein
LLGRSTKRWKENIKVDIREKGVQNARFFKLITRVIFAQDV